VRYALGIEYDGTAYNGWQRQESGIGIQEQLERAISSVAGHAVEVHGAGRTDAGVHASGQVAHFDSDSVRSLRGWLLGANSNLPPDVSVEWVCPVPVDFHARFSALRRRYRYLILNRLVRSALLRSRAWWVHQPLDVGSMHAAGQLLVGRHDFSAFRAAGCQAASAVREVVSLSVQRDGDFVAIDIAADAFLQRMVRNVAGTLAAVGLGEQPVTWVAEVLGRRDRTLAGMAAPPHGLTLVEVTYPDAFGIPPVGKR
jgi:tRNA pseudouridine38-40 synthase